MKPHFCESSNSFSVMVKRPIPLVSIFQDDRNGLKEFDGTRAKTTYAASRLSKPVARTVKCKVSCVDSLYGVMLKLVIGGKVKSSLGNRGYALRAHQHFRDLMSNLPSPGIIKCCSTSRHFEKSATQFHFLGNPTISSRSVTLTDESFLAMNLNTTFDFPSCTGITRHPFG